MNLLNETSNHKQIYEHLSSTGVFNLNRLKNDEKEIVGNNILTKIPSSIIESSSDILFSGEIKNQTCKDTINNLVMTFIDSSDYFKEGARLSYGSDLLGFVKFHKKMNLYATSSVAINSRSFVKFPLIQKGIYSFSSNLYKHIMNKIEFKNKNDWIDVNLKDFNEPVSFKLNLIAHLSSFRSSKEYSSFMRNVDLQIKEFYS